MSLPVLYSFRRCPYAIRARIALQHTHTQVRLREVVLRDKPEDMLRASPKGTVPVLVLSDGHVIDESHDIMRWCLAANNRDRWLTQDDQDIEARSLIHENDFSFKDQLDLYKYHSRHSEGTGAAARDKAVTFLQELERRIETNGHLIRPDRCYVDAAIFPFVRQFANVDREWFDTLPLPGLHTWLNVWLTDPLFLNVMHKYTPWDKTTSEPLFPDSPDERNCT